MPNDVVLRNAVAAAVMAPSSHNTQPWRFKIADGALELHADPRRQLLVIDRDYRQLVESCGCALMNARVAIRAMGYEDDVRVMLSNRDLPTHIASVRLGAPRPPTETDHELMRAIGRRGTNRRSFLARPLGEAFTELVATVARNEGVTLVRFAPADKEELAELVADADHRQLGDPRFRQELASWLAPPGSHRRDGIPFVEKEYGSSCASSMHRTMRSPLLGEAFGTLEQSLVRGAPAVIVLGTSTDDPRGWLACGQALQAVLLYATAYGYAGAFLNQVLEIPELRRRVAHLAAGIGYPQMILRIGVPAEPIERVAPRRSIDDVLES